MIRPFIFAITVIYVCSAVEFQIYNKFNGSIWVGILGNSGKLPLRDGGFQLAKDKMKKIHSCEDWAGRFWARTFCVNDTCETGDCGSKLECNGTSGAPPATLAEIALNVPGGNDFYFVSLVEGFNVPISIVPLGGQGPCETAACAVDINPECPLDLRLQGTSGMTVGCFSACSKYNTDQYCCSEDYGLPETCDPGTWSVNSAAYFKRKCPQAYSYAFDDPASTFTCKAPAYKIIFG